MAKEQKLKTCFVIVPIGDEGSEIRRRSDQVLTHMPIKRELWLGVLR